MELAVDYRRAVSDGVALELYAGAAGEPALGPVAYPHRLSAARNPMSPISHHWLDATHISFGVATGAIYGRRWKTEVSAFNGREPDDSRYGFDFARLDSWSTRAWSETVDSSMDTTVSLQRAVASAHALNASTARPLGADRKRALPCPASVENSYVGKSPRIFMRPARIHTRLLECRP
jgi:hypothetical protein